METEVVKFYSDEIVCYKGRVLVATIANAIGLNVDSAVRGIKNHKILGPEHTVEYVQVGENQSRQYLTIPTEYVMGWLFSIDISKVNEEIRPKLELYQRECYKALNDHFFGKNKVVTDSQKELAYIYTRIKEIDRSIKDGLTERRQLVQRKSIIECENFRQLGIQFENFDTAEVVEDEIKGFLNKN